MWIFTTKGFFSVVQQENDPDHVLIRARVRKDIQSLKRLFDALGLKTGRVIVNPRFDYKYRFTAGRKDWIVVMTRLMLDLDYRNFKDAVYKVDSRDFRENRHEAYSQVWTTMRKLQFLESISNRSLKKDKGSQGGHEKSGSETISEPWFWNSGRAKRPGKSEGEV